MVDNNEVLFRFWRFLHKKKIRRHYQSAFEWYPKHRKPKRNCINFWSKIYKIEKDSITKRSKIAELLSDRKSPELPFQSHLIALRIRTKVQYAEKRQTRCETGNRYKGRSSPCRP